MVYVTLSVSPDTTERSPGEVKSDAEKSVPVVPLFALPLVRNAPPTVDVALMEKDAGVPEFVATEGLALVAAVKEHATRVLLLYGVTSVQPA